MDGENTIITPPDGAYDIFYYIDRAKAGAGYENKWTDNIGGYVHDYEDCFESYRNFLEVKVRTCQ